MGSFCPRACGRLVTPKNILSSQAQCQRSQSLKVSLLLALCGSGQLAQPGLCREGAVRRSHFASLKHGAETPYPEGAGNYRTLWSMSASRWSWSQTEFGSHAADLARLTSRGWQAAMISLLALGREAWTPDCPEPLPFTPAGSQGSCEHCSVAITGLSFIFSSGYPPVQLGFECLAASDG